MHLFVSYSFYFVKNFLNRVLVIVYYYYYNDYLGCFLEKNVPWFVFYYTVIPVISVFQPSAYSEKSKQQCRLVIYFKTFTHIMHHSECRTSVNQRL